MAKALGVLLLPPFYRGIASLDICCLGRESSESVTGVKNIWLSVRKS